MTTLSWPSVSVQPTRFEWWLAAVTQEHRSPLDGTVQTQGLSAARWEARVEYYNVSADDAAILKAFIVAMRGRAGRVYVREFGRPGPRGVGGGTPVVDGAGQAGASLAVAGGPLSTSGWLQTGDIFGVNGQAYMLTAPANTDGTGDATLAIAPPLRSSPANGATVTLVAPQVTMMFAGDRNGWTYEPAARGRHTFVFDLVEAF